jgi:hypothetical protein
MDIKYTPDGDIDLSSGDIRYIDGTEQHKLTVLLARKGEIIHNADIGVDAMEYLLNEEPGDLLREVRRQCRKVGMIITRVNFEDNKIKIAGGYEGN